MILEHIVPGNICSERVTNKIKIFELIVHLLRELNPPFFEVIYKIVDRLLGLNIFIIVLRS